MKNRPSLKLIKDPEIARKHGEICDRIEEHCRNHLGEIEDNLTQPDILQGYPMDIMIVEPNPKRDYFTLVTAGVSNFEYDSSYGSYESSRFMELYLNLPNTWRLDDEALDSLKMRWPLELLHVAALLCLNCCHIHHGATMMLPSELVSHRLTPSFNFFSLLSSMKECIEFEHLPLSKGSQIDFYNVFPVHTTEWLWVEEHGVESFENLLMVNGLSRAIDPNRDEIITG